MHIGFSHGLVSNMETNAAHLNMDTEEELPVGTTLSGDQFTITSRLGAGGFGITYRAMDNVLGRTVVIKECFPTDFCYRDGRDVMPHNKGQAEQASSIVQMFMREARSLAKLRHPNIVGVHRAFEENQTAYMALDLIDGPDMLDLLESSEAPLSPDRVKDILMQLLYAIEKVHEMDLLHRDISPDNIIVERNGTPVLIDFGAARGDASRRTRAMSSLLVVKDGYSPHEFYVAGSMQTPSSDLYALGATFYHILSGQAPINSQARMMEVASNNPDPCPPLLGRIEGYPNAFLQAIDKAMQVHPGDRLQSAAEWRDMISGVQVNAKTSAFPSQTNPRREVGGEFEVALSRLVEETNVEVRKSRELQKTKVLKTEPDAEALKPPKSKAPEWLEEFNRESMAKASASEPASTNDSRRGTRTRREQEATRVLYMTPEPAKTGTNWVDRAVEKQQREREERQAAYEARLDDMRKSRIVGRNTAKPAAKTAPTSFQFDEPEVVQSTSPILIALFALIAILFLGAFGVVGAILYYPDLLGL